LKYAETLKKAIDTYSPMLQSVVAMEEMGELIQEISKDLRGKGDIDHLAEEIADVQIMLDQLAIIHDCSMKVGEYKAAKVARLRDRLEGKA
jgi:NTP pyrophosphatase (non-canonical NTP hydrolase)